MENQPQAIVPSAYLSAADLMCGDDDCAICLDPFDDGNPSQNTTCGHKFHFQCVLQWQERSNCCPLCWKLFNIEGEDVPTVARLPASPLNLGQRPPQSILNSVPRETLDGDLLIEAQLAQLLGLRISQSHGSSSSSMPRHSVHSGATQWTSPSGRFSSRNRSRSYHVEASSSRPTEHASPNPQSPRHSPSSPFSKLKTALSDVFGSRRRSRHQDHLQPQVEASSSRSPSHSPGRGFSSASHSPSSAPITPTTQLGPAVVEPATLLDLNHPHLSQTSPSAQAEPSTPPLHQLSSHRDHGANELEDDLANTSNPATVLSFMNTQLGDDGEELVLGDHEAQSSSQEPHLSPEVTATAGLES